MGNVERKRRRIKHRHDLTTDANKVIEPIHDRKPVVLEPDEIDPWLESDDEDEVHSFLDPFPNELTDSYPVSKRVNDVTYDSPEVIEPFDRRGLLNTRLQILSS